MEGSKGVCGGGFGVRAMRVLAAAAAEMGKRRFLMNMGRERERESKGSGRKEVKAAVDLAMG